MVVRVGHACKHICVNIELDGESISFVDKARYLDVFLASGRRFKISVNA